MDAVVGGEKGNEPAEGPPGLRESMHEEHRSSVVAGGHVVQLCAVDLRGGVPHLGDRCVVESHGSLLE